MWRMDEWLGCVLQVIERTEALAAQMDHPDSLNARIKSFASEVKSNYQIRPGIFMKGKLTEPWKFDLELNNAVIGMHGKFLALLNEAKSVNVSLKHWMYLVFEGRGLDYSPSWAALFENFLWDRFMGGVESARARNRTIRGFYRQVGYIAAVIQTDSPMINTSLKDIASVQIPFDVLDTLRRKTQADFNAAATIADHLGWRGAYIQDLLQDHFDMMHGLYLAEIWSLWVNNRPRP